MINALPCVHNQDVIGRRTYIVEDIARVLEIGRAFAYSLVKEGHFKTVRIGTVIRISKKLLMSD